MRLWARRNLCYNFARMSAVVNDDQIQHLMQMLRGAPLFSELRDDELRALAGISVSATFQPGQYLYRQGDDDKVMFVILSGRVALFHIDPQGVESFVEYREPGPKGWLGEAALIFIRKHPWSLGRSMLVPSTMLVGAVLVASLLSATVPALSAVFWILA